MVVESFESSLECIEVKLAVIWILKMNPFNPSLAPSRTTNIAPDSASSIPDLLKVDFDQPKLNSSMQNVFFICLIPYQAFDIFWRQA